MAIEVGERLGSAEDIADIPLPPAQEMPGATPGGEGEMPERMPGGEGELPEGAMPEGEMPEGELPEGAAPGDVPTPDRKSTRLNSSHVSISYAVFCLQKKSNT